MKKEKNNKLLLLWYSHPRIAIACVLVVANLFIILLFTSILSLLSGESFFSELAYLFTYTMSPDGIYDFVNNQEDLNSFIIKIVLTVIQMVIFSGALIGFTTDILQNTFDKRLENKGKLHLKNHFVFLNWSSIGANIIYDLSFLDGEKTIVILAENEREEIINAIDNIFVENARKKKGIRLFVKKGNPTSSKHLSDISLDSAKHIGVLLSDKENDEKHGMSTRDLASFKLLMSILHLNQKANIVVEVEENETVTKIEQLFETTYPELRTKVNVFSHNSVIGHILGRAVVSPTFANLYYQLLSFDGVEFYGIKPMDIEQALYTYNDCIPIANYDDDDEIDATGEKQVDQLYVLSDKLESLGKREQPKSFVTPISYRKNLNPELFTLFIFSDSNRATFVQNEIESYNKIYNSNIVCECHSYDENITNLIETMNQKEGNKKILLLSSENTDSDHQDAEVFLSLLALKSDGRINKKIDIFVEIVNPNNLVSLENMGVASVIVSNKIISLFMVQLLTHPGSKKFYRDVLIVNDKDDKGSVDFEILKASEVIDFKNEQSVKFTSQSNLVQSFYIASNKQKMLIGINDKKSNFTSLRFLCDDMDKEEDLVLYPEDEVVIVSYN